VLHLLAATLLWWALSPAQFAARCSPSAAGAAGFVSRIATDPELRDAARRCAIQARIGELSARYAPRAARLPPAARAELAAREAELAQSEAALAHPPGDAASITVSQRSAAGIPPALLALFPRQRGGYAVPVDALGGTLLAWARSPQVRQAFYLARERLAASDAPALEHVAELQDRIAHLLGAESYADIDLTGGPFEVPEGIEKFVDETGAALAPAASAQRAAMQSAVRADQRDARYGLQPWDELRAGHLLAGPAPAPPLDAALGAARTFGLAFAPLGGGSGWAPGVAGYAVSDAATGRPLGALYVDLYARAGKRGAPGAYPLGSSGAAVIADWPPPDPSSQGGPNALDARDLFASIGTAVGLLLAPSAEPRGDRAATVALTARIFEELAGPISPGARAYEAERLLAAAGLQSAYESRVAAADPAALPAGGQMRVETAWAAVYGEDLAEAFAADPAAAAARYRATLLSPHGRSLDEAMTAFLGRAALPDAFFAGIGVPQP